MFKILDISIFTFFKSNLFQFSISRLDPLYSFAKTFQRNNINRQPNFYHKHMLIVWSQLYANYNIYTD